MKRALTVLFLLAFGVVSAAQTATYRWVDRDGVVHYSDSPNPDSSAPEQDRIELATPNVMQSRVPRLAAGTVRQAGTDEESAATAYRSMRIVSPVSDQMLWNIGGQLNVSVQTEPALQPGHGVVVFLDGKPKQDTPPRSTSVTLSEVWRGEHTLRAVVRGADGKDLISSDPITFYVQQTN